MVPDPIDLARRMRRLTQWVDSRRQPPTLIRRQFRGGSLGNCYVTIDPDRQTPFASSNLNRVYMCGAEAGMSSSSVASINSHDAPISVMECAMTGRNSSCVQQCT